MDLESINSITFDSRLLWLSMQSGFSYRIRPGIRCEAYLKGKLALLMVNEAGCAKYFRAPDAPWPVVSAQPGSVNYK